jgi:hypothetical protein
MKIRFRDEYTGADLGDARRSERLAELGMALAAFPAASFPEALGDGAGLEAAYRFFGNEAVEPAAVLEPHIRETAARCEDRAAVIVPHDSTDFVFTGKRQGLGRMRGHKERGFFAHLSLAVSWDTAREPLGVLGLETWIRGRTKTSTPWNTRLRQTDPDRESTRWLRGVLTVEETVPRTRTVHVMDREADDYQLFSALIAGRHRFIVRSKFDRRLEGDGLLGDALSAFATELVRDVPLTKRRQPLFPSAQKVHPARDARVAKLAIKAGQVVLQRPNGMKAEVPKHLPINVVVVEELVPPKGEAPVAWRLYTTEPIHDSASLERIVDGYRCRWVVEEFFKVLKTGCGIERRQLESRHALENALAVFVPIAWRVLRHRTLAKTDGGNKASLVLSKLQIQLLRRASKTRLPRALTVEDALIAVAALGGHLKRNGSPGWITLLRGYERLLTLEEGARLVGEM